MHGVTFGAVSQLECPCEALSTIPADRMLNSPCERRRRDTRILLFNCTIHVVYLKCSLLATSCPSYISLMIFHSATVPPAVAFLLY